MIPRFAHISPYLKKIHWLAVKFRTEFKITILTFQAIHGLAPKYLPRDLRLLNSISTFKNQLKTYLFRAAYDIT